MAHPALSSLAHGDPEAHTQPRVEGGWISVTFINKDGSLPRRKHHKDYGFLHKKVKKFGFLDGKADKGIKLKDDDITKKTAEKLNTKLSSSECQKALNKSAD